MAAPNLFQPVYEDQHKNASIGNDLKVVNNLMVCGNSTINGNIDFKGNLLQNGEFYKTHLINNFTDNWSQLGSDLDGETGDYAGYSISLSGDGTIVAVSSPTYDSDKGTVRVYKWYNASWNMIGNEGDLDGETEDYAGHSITLSGDGTIVAIGSLGHDSNKGTARVYNWNGSNWIRLGNDEELEGESGNSAGTSISLSNDGTIVAIGSENYGNEKGIVRVYEWSGSNWIRLGSDNELVGSVQGEKEGCSVALSSDGTIVAVGVYEYVGVNGISSGTARVYNWNGSNWIRLGNDEELEGERGNSAGTSIALSCDGTIVALGSPGYNGFGGAGTLRGTARVYKWNGFIWDMIGNEGELDGLANNDTAGNGVALSNDGTILAVGASSHSNSTNSGGSSTYEGTVRVYKWNGKNWNMIGNEGDLDGETGDFSGKGLALSSNGTILAVGGYTHDNDKGTARIYTIQKNILMGDLAISKNLTVDDNTGVGKNLEVNEVLSVKGKTYLGSDLTVDRNTALKRDLTVDGNTTVSDLTVDGNTTVSGTAYASEFKKLDGTSIGGAQIQNGGAQIQKFSNNWSQIGSDLDGENGDYTGNYPGDHAGNSVALNSDGTIIAVGAQDHDNGLDTNEGTARVYEWNGSNWNMLGAEGDLDGESEDKAGRSVALSSDGTTVVVGANQHNSWRGTARVYKWNGSNWNMLGTEGELEGQLGDYAGWSVALSSDGTIVAVGAHYHDDGSNANEGTARVYKWNGSNWNMLGEEGDLDGKAGNEAGYSVALSSDGTIVAVGAQGYDKGSGQTNEGTARVYKWDGSIWNMLGEEGDLDGSAGDRAGYSVALSSNGTIVAVGTALYDKGSGETNEGTARVYEWNGSNWNMLGTEGELEGKAGDTAGFRVALSSDGTILAVGAPSHSNSTNSGGSSTYEGTARVYKWNGSNWNMLGAEGDLDGKAGDRAGQGVALSSDGTIVAVGGYTHSNGTTTNEGNGRIEGTARVYTIQKNILMGDLAIGNNLNVGNIQSNDLTVSNNNNIANLIKKYRTNNIISCGEDTTAIVLNTGEVMACGRNDHGQLGDGTYINRTTLVSMNIPSGSSYTGSNAVEVASNTYQTLILLNTGEVLANGNNHYGQLGVGNNTTKYNKLVSMIESPPYDKTNAVAISTGFALSAVLLKTGKVMTCGYNSNGQLGIGNTNNKNKLVSMTESPPYVETNAVAISCGHYHIAVLLKTGEVMVCGSNDDGQLGIGSIGSGTNSNKLVSMSSSPPYDGKNAVAISCGSYHTAILLNTGEVMSCGKNNHHQLGDETSTARPTLVSIKRAPGTSYTGSNAVAISCGASHTAILLNTGEVMSCGFNQYGQLGDGANANRQYLVSMKESSPYDKTNAVAISCGIIHTAILLNTGEVMVCGYNQNGQIGNGTSGVGTNKTQLVSMNSSGNYDTSNVFSFHNGNINCDRISNNVINCNKLVSTGSIVGNSFFGNIEGNDSLKFKINKIDKMVLNYKGYVGIGTDDPQVPLHINISNLKSVTYYSYYNSAGVKLAPTSNGYTSSESLSIMCADILCSELMISSDRRIKKNIVDVPDNLALEMLNKIPCRYYEYKDHILKGEGKTIGFIAQEVREAMPMAINIGKSIIPNEMRKLDVSWNNTTLTTDLHDVSGVKYRFYVSNDVSGNDEVEKDIIGNADNSFTFDQSYNNVFCYGKEVDNFHTLDKQKLFALNFSATQEISRIQQQQLIDISKNTISTQLNKTEIDLLKQENAELKTEVQTLKTQLNDVLSRISLLENA